MFLELTERQVQICKELLYEKIIKQKPNERTEYDLTLCELIEQTGCA